VAKGSFESVTRQCSRPGCSEPAQATLTYVHSSASAWLDALTEERDPHGYDLCERHAGRVTVPRGWHFLDRRVPTLVLAERMAG